MRLVAGIRVGPYEILAPLGAGGMAQTLPDAFARDSERLARFRREAQALAQLNHPHIAAIHAFEESDGVQALVLELVDGPTLADRIAAGPIPVEDALPIARQIAEALEAAHEQGIVHRDLKPPLFDTNVTGFFPYDVSPDGRFLLNTISEAAALTASPVTNVLNWQAGLRR